VFELLLLIFDLHNHFRQFCIYNSNPVYMHLSILNFFNFFISSSSSICEKFINFDKRNDTIKVTIRKPKQVHQWDHTLRRNLKKQPSATRLQQAAPQATNDSNKPFKRRQQQSSTARSQILAEIVFPQSSIFFRRIKSRPYFWKSLVRGRTILKGKVIVVNVHMRNHVCVLNLKSPKRMPTRTSHRTFLLVLFLSLRTFLFTAL